MPWLIKLILDAFLLAGTLVSVAASGWVGSAIGSVGEKGEIRAVSGKSIFDDPNLQALRSLADSATKIGGSVQVLVLYFSDPDCAYCRRLENEVLLPMQRSGDYQHRVLLRQVHWRGPLVITDFDGKPLPAIELAARYDIHVSPTLVFVDASGREVAPRILGYNGEFFWHRLDRSIVKALGFIRAGKRQP